MFRRLSGENDVDLIASAYLNSRMLIQKPDQSQFCFVWETGAKFEIFIQFKVPISCGKENAIDISQPHNTNLNRRHKLYKHPPCMFNCREVIIQAGIWGEPIERKPLCPNLDKLFLVLL